MLHLRPMVAANYGLQTDGHRLLCLVVPAGDADEVIGYVWFKPDAENARPSSTISRFSRPIGQGPREAGHGDLDQRVEGPRLRADQAPGGRGQQARARHVYEATGFRVTGINMSKSLMSK